MDSFVLQDWTTIRGGSGITITQSEHSWLDLSPYEDVVFWLLASEVTGGVPSLLYQTSPTADEAFFAAQTLGMSGSAVALVAGTTPIVTPALAWNVPFPLARFVRWQILPPASTFDVTMRIVVAAVAPSL